MDTGDWRAHITYNFPLDMAVVQVYRPRPDGGLEVVTRFTEDGYGIVDTFAGGVVVPFGGFVLPRSAIEAIGEQLKPGPSQAELDRVVEALGVERARVDRIITKAVG